MQNETNNDRRQFFKTVGSAAAAMAAASPLIKPSEASAAVSERYFAAFRHVLSFGDQQMGMLRSFDGGEAYADVVLEPVDGAGIVKKHIAGVKYEDIKASVGADLNPTFYTWIQLMLLRDPAFRDGSISSADANNRARLLTSFTGGFLTSVAFPALDAAAKDPATIDLRIACTSVQEGDAPPSGTAPLIPAKSKPWLTSNFRLTISGISDFATSRIHSIAAFTARQNIIGEAGGTLTIDPLELGPLVVTLPEQNAQPFYDWHRQFVIQGQCSDNDERTAILQYLNSSGAILFTLFLGNVGIYRVSRLSEDGRRAGIRRVKAEMYCETARLFVGDLPTA